jgi:hypothetical protein
VVHAVHKEPASLYLHLPSFQIVLRPKNNPVFRPSRDLLENMSSFLFREKYLVINDTVSRLWYNHNHPAPLFLFLPFPQ